MADTVTVERRGVRFWTLRAVRLAAVAYLAVVAFLYIAQAWLIFPGQMSHGKSYAHVTPPAGAELVHLTTGMGDDVVALFGPALSLKDEPLADAASRPTIVFFYGNGDCLANNADVFRAFRRVGANVLIPEYPGYGMSGGSPGELECRSAAEAAFDYLAARPDVDPKRIYASGWSLGSAVAVDLATRRPVAGLAIFSSFTSMVDMGRLAYPFIPVSWLLRHRFESEAKLATVSCPVLVVHGRADSIIPFAMSERLAAAARGPATVLAIDGADHGNVFAVGGAKLLDAISRFVGTR
jgi:pimeloyl-ACP methyl ester carboxylesterase